MNECSQNANAGHEWKRVLGWAVYLACSWTWCIGMFLPVLLVRDYGVLGYIVFAVPNVVGAAAMGWVIHTGKISRRVVSRHMVACRMFSAITIAFQTYFLLTFILIPWNASGDFATRVGIAGGVLIGGMVLLRLTKFERAGAWLTWLVSLAGLGVLLTMSDAVKFPAALYATHNLGGLLFMMPVVVFGFVLCPYLDLTFHRAARRTRVGATRRTFALGFGVFFLTMILGTLLYASAMLDAHRLGDIGYLPLIAGVPILVHVMMQLAFTTGEHSRFTRSPKWAWGVAIGILAWIIAAWMENHENADSNVLGVALTAGEMEMHASEIAYRGFMGFYGLVFPAYVWVCMIPKGGAISKPSRESLWVFAATVVVAMPCYWMGFIEQQEWWLMPGLGVVLIARVFIRPSSSHRRI